jgi:hypothetical protein
MTITVPIDPAANAYISVTDADTFFVSRIGSAVWDGASATDREAALIMAARQLDSLAWRGTRTHTDAENGLRWPRTSVRNADGQEISSALVPQAIIAANAELALAILTAGGAEAGAALESIKVGSIELEFGESSQSGLPSAVDDLVAPYIKGSGSLSLVRA